MTTPCAMNSGALNGCVQMTNDEYHSAPGISKSHLDAIAEKSPRHYWHEYLNPNRDPSEGDSPALLLGSAIHSAILEPSDFEDRYAVAPECDRRTKLGKEVYAAFLALNDGKEVLSASDYRTCIRIRDAVHAHPVASGLLTGGVAEQSIFASDPETGELIKCRVDYLLNGLSGMIIDVKSTPDASPRAFGHSAAAFRYDIQPPWYFDVLQAAFGIQPTQFVWLAFEKLPPYAVGVYFARPADIQMSRITARRDFHRILHYKRLNQWPDYGAQIRPLELPGYAKRGEE